MHREDAQLVQRMLDAEPGAHEALLEHLRAIVYERARSASNRYRVAADAREDLVQEFWAMLAERQYQVLRSYEGRSRLTTFIYAIATRFFFRRAKVLRMQIEDRPASEVFEAVPDPSPSPFAQVADRTRAQKVRAVLDGLPERDRVLLQMIYEQDVPAAVVGRMLGISDAGVRMRKRRLLNKLQKRLVHLWDEEERT